MQGELILTYILLFISRGFNENVGIALEQFKKYQLSLLILFSKWKIDRGYLNFQATNEHGIQAIVFLFSRNVLIQYKGNFLTSTFKNQF